MVYAVAARREELGALNQLLEADQTSPTAVESEPHLRAVIDDMEREGQPSLRLRASDEEFVDDLRELVAQWDEQIDGQIGTLWWPIGADTRLYLHYLELRADAEDDQFSFPESAGQVHTLVQRGLSAIEDDDDSKLAVVHKRDIPWEEPAEDS